jgi:hypothetical protein
MIDILNELSLQSFWEESDRISLLPIDNYFREDYLKKLLELEKSNLLISLMGQRRAGKSVISKQYIYNKKKSGIPSKNILYINFFLQSLESLKETKKFNSTLKIWNEDFINHKLPSYLILDEVQELENWDETLASIFEDPNFKCQIIITGSNSQMISEKFSEKLSGRYICLNVYPFSFNEYCKSLKKKVSIENIEDFLNTGGMPEVIKIKNLELRQQLISDVINSTVKNDIIKRFAPNNPLLLYSLIDYCRASFSTEISINSIANFLAKKLKTKNPNLIQEYLHYLESVYFIHLPKTYSYRNKDLLDKKVDKIYLGDLAFAQYKAKSEKGRLLENMIYLELRKKGYKIQRYFAYKNKNLEIDFHIEKVDYIALIQVSWLLGDKNENKELWSREFGNLSSVNLDVDKFVVTLDKEIISPFREIKHLNVIEFLNKL